MSHSSSEMDFHQQDFLHLLLYLTSFRMAMTVKEIMVFPDAYLGETGYYVCPRCHITMEREFMSYCDRCGQHLDWKDYKKVRRIYPTGMNPAAEAPSTTQNRILAKS